MAKKSGAGNPPLPFDAEAFALMKAAAVNKSAAFALLALTARRLRAGEALAPHLAEFIAVAFERTARTLDHAELASSLLLRARNRRPSADWIEVAARVEELRQSMSIGNAHRAAAKEFAVDVRSVRRYWNTYQVARAFED